MADSDRGGGGPRSSGRWLRRGLRTAAGLAVAAALAAGAGALWLRSRFRASLPQATGERVLAGLGAPVRIQRDALGVPAIQAADRLDAARALGFLHAQERFFQMDLERRLAAGELAELVGPPALVYDRRYRIYRFREVARRVLDRLPDRERRILAAYTAGVNAGLAALGAWPFEYVLLRVGPVPWRPEDSVLCLEAMFIQLQDDPGNGPSRLAAMHDRMPGPLFDFLAPTGTEWDAPWRAAR